MTDKTLAEATDPIVRIAWILWIAFVLAMAVYGVVPHFLVLEGDPVSGLGLVFWVVGGALAAAAFLYRRWAFSDEVLKRASEADSPTTQLDPRERRLLAVAKHALKHQIVILALIEAIALLGFLHGLLGRDESLGLPLIGGALALALLSFPRVREAMERGRAWG